MKEQISCDLSIECARTGAVLGGLWWGLREKVCSRCLTARMHILRARTDATPDRRDGARDLDDAPEAAQPARGCNVRKPAVQRRCSCLSLTLANQQSDRSGSLSPAATPRREVVEESGVDLSYSDKKLRHARAIISLSAFAENIGCGRVHLCRGTFMLASPTHATNRSIWIQSIIHSGLCYILLVRALSFPIPSDLAPPKAGAQPSVIANDFPFSRPHALRRRWSSLSLRWCAGALPLRVPSPRGRISSVVP